MALPCGVATPRVLGAYRPAWRDARQHIYLLTYWLTSYLLVGRLRNSQVHGPSPRGTQLRSVAMSVMTKPVTAAAIKQAIEGRDGRMLASFYADDAVVRVVDRDNPPSKPREISGRAAIVAYWDDVCGRAMTHK